MVAHLPPTIKHLLTLRNPGVLPGPSLSKLYGVLTRTSRDAKVKNAETGWLVLTVRFIPNHAASCHWKFGLDSIFSSDMHPSHCQSPSDPGSSVSLRDQSKQSSFSDECQHGQRREQSCTYAGVCAEKCYFRGRSPSEQSIPFSRLSSYERMEDLNRTLQVILSLAALHEALEDEVRNALRTESRRYDRNDFSHRLPRRPFFGLLTLICSETIFVFTGPQRPRTSNR